MKRKAKATQDYSITMRDESGRTCILYINGASVDESSAESVEGNAFQNAIARGEIGDDAWAIEVSRD
jgi:hypothetical protein